MTSEPTLQFIQIGGSIYKEIHLQILYESRFWVKVRNSFNLRSILNRSYIFSREYVGIPKGILLIDELTFGVYVTTAGTGKHYSDEVES